MAVKLGEKILKDIYLGDKRIVKAYFGNKLVFEADKPIFVDYIESTAVAYIDTEYIMTSDNQEVEIEFQYTNSTGTRVMFGSLPTTNRSIHSYSDGTNTLCVYAGNGMNLSYNNFDYNLKHTLYAKAVVGKVLYAELDGVAKTSSGILTTLNKENPWYLFARNDGTNKNINGNFIGRIYRFKMKDNGVVVRDFRPCVHPKTFKACMYDLVTHKYFYNKYSTVFTPAPRFVEYLESTGTQYINLGYISPERAKTLRFVADMSIDTASGYRLCGSGSYNRQLYFGFSSSGTFAYGPGNVDAAVGGYGKVGIKYHYDYDALNGSYVVSENGTIVASKQFEFSGYTGANFYLFCYAGANEVPTALWSGKIYSFLVYENNALIQHLRPCLMGNTPCMYDMVSGTYLYNQGTGEFKYGRLI
jgi:hypothetical protein